MKREIKATADGSKTIYLPELDEQYHSVHGALQEAQHVFISNGLNIQTADYITVLEMGFGTGLNTLLTYFSSEKRNQYVHYIGIEAFPVSENEWRELEYDQFSKDPDAKAVYERIHTCEWNKAQEISEHFVLEKQLVELKNAQVEPLTVDLLYFDAFGPRVQPELWALEIFNLLFSWIAPGGILVTYCAKGQVKRDLKAAGFELETLPGPPGKREMVRAKKPS